LSDGAAAGQSGQRLLVRPRPSYPTTTAPPLSHLQDSFGQDSAATGAAFHRYSDSDAVFNRSRLPYNTDYTRSTDLSILPVTNRYLSRRILCRFNLFSSLSTSDLEQSLTNSLNSYNNSSVYSQQQHPQQQQHSRTSQPSTPRRLRQVKRVGGNTGGQADDDDDYDVVPEFVDLLKGEQMC
jgi:hypothetical protein